jgi:hypothetical protein
MSVSPSHSGCGPRYLRYHIGSSNGCRGEKAREGGWESKSQEEQQTGCSSGPPAHSREPATTAADSHYYCHKIASKYGTKAVAHSWTRPWTCPRSEHSTVTICCATRSEWKQQEKNDPCKEKANTCCIEYFVHPRISVCSCDLTLHGNSLL